MDFGYFLCTLLKALFHSDTTVLMETYIPSIKQTAIVLLLLYIFFLAVVGFWGWSREQTWKVRI